MTLWVSWTIIYSMIVLPIAYSKLNHEWNAPATITYEECTKTICKEEAEDIIACMNPKVDPCEDFYEYVCGNWPQKHIDPNKQYRNFPWGIENSLQYKAYLDIRSTLEEPFDPHESADDTKAKILYRNCMKLPWMGKLNAVDMKPIVSDAGIWPMFPLEINNDTVSLNWVPIHNYYLKLSGESALFGLAIKYSAINQSPILEIRKMLSPYGLFTRLSSWTLKETNGYIKYLSTIANDVKPSNAVKVPSNMFHRYIEDVIHFRNQIQKILNGLGKGDKTSMTIDFLNTMYNERSAIHRTTAKIPWLNIVQTLYENDTSVKIDEKTPIVLSYSPYFLGLRTLLDKTSSRTIINHIHPYFIERHLQLIFYELWQLIVDIKILVNHIHLYFIERHLQLTTEQQELYYATRNMAAQEPVAKNRVFPEKWFGCIEKHDLPNIIGQMYIENHSSRMMVEHVKRMIKGIKDMVMVQINDSAWLDENTKTLSKLKITNLKVAIGYPRWYERPSKKTHHTGGSVLPYNPEAKYDLYKNKMYITAVYFQSPMYSVFLPFNMNYASMGSLIGHEIYHSLDIRGIWFDFEGKKRAWWPAKMFTIFNIKRGCFRNQYGNYKVKEFQEYKDAPTKARDYSTVSEDIADTMGLKVAYEAYRLRLFEEGHVCNSLPQLSKYSCDAMFFISFARTFCFAATPRQLMFAMRYDEHSTPRIRVNGAVSNMPEFSDAFKCSANAPLNPKRRCDLWE